MGEVVAVFRQSKPCIALHVQCIYQIRVSSYVLGHIHYTSICPFSVLLKESHLPLVLPVIKRQQIML